MIGVRLMLERSIVAGLYGKSAERKSLETLCPCSRCHIPATVRVPSVPGSTRPGFARGANTAQRRQVRCGTGTPYRDSHGVLERDRLSHPVLLRRSRTRDLVR